MRISCTCCPSFLRDHQSKSLQRVTDPSLLSVLYFHICSPPYICCQRKRQRFCTSGLLILVPAQQDARLILHYFRPTFNRINVGYMVSEISLGSRFSELHILQLDSKTKPLNVTRVAQLRDGINHFFFGH